MKISCVYSVILVCLVLITCFPTGHGCSKEQKSALLQIRNLTNGFAFSSWDGRDCCEADGGNICGDYSDEEVRSIYLDGTGEPMLRKWYWYPNATLFTVFDALEELHLVNIGIGGQVQAFCELKKLESLRILDLRNNRLDGSIHPCLGMMNLEQLDLSNNKLQGNVPPSIFSDDSNFRLFDVSGNKLEGVLPMSIFANASSLFYLDLSKNYLLELETESPPWIPSFQLDVLILADCKLNKKNSHVFPSFISTQYGLEWLDLSHNSLEGTIPCWLLFNSSVSALFLRGNKFDFPSLGCYDNGTSLLKSLDISNNHVKGLLPENIGIVFPKLYHVNMSSNALEGSIPWSLGELPLEILDLSYNMFSGAIPRSFTRSGTSLVYLNLSNNRLQGEMLPKDSNMTKLECLQLSNNFFEGIISPTLSRSLSLVILDVRNNQLSGNIPKWLYDHPHLVAVLLRGNHFEGHLRRRMCQMETLQVLDISNNLLSGGIPSCLGNITFWKKSSPSPNGTNYFTQKGRLYYLMNPINTPDMDMGVSTDFLTKNMLYTFSGLPLSLMTGLDMSLNQLTGNIPFEMGELSQLRSLNLSGNLLTGPIPTSFRDLKSMESLDLSHNNLSGKIPYEMVELTSLSSFCVAYNNLSGRIPFEQQFSTFDMHCFDGNPFLCGELLPRNCSPLNPLEPQHEDKKEETSIIDSNIFFYGFIAVSYAFGFWVFFGILIYNKRWRHNYFRAVDRYIQSCLDCLKF